MDDRFTKYSKLYLLIFLMSLCVPVVIGLFVALMYGFFSLVPVKPASMVYELLIISLAPSVFAAVYYIFFKRTKKHPAAVVRGISYIMFGIGFCSCIVVLALDYKSFFNNAIFGAGGYYSFAILFLAGNIASLFLIALLQALTTNKEEDWVEKRKKKQV